MIESLITAAIRKAWPVYKANVAAILDGKSADWDGFRRLLTKALVMGNLIGRDESARSAIAAGAELEITGDEIKIPSSQYVVSGPKTLLSKPLVEAANEFRNTIPGLAKGFADVLKFGESKAWFITGVEDQEIIQKVGKQIADMLHDPETGEAAINMGKFFEESEDALQLARWRLENIFRTTVSEAAEAGKWIQDQDPVVKSITPFYYISTADDPRVRPHHSVFQGAAWPSTDPFWQTCRPPFSYQCRCARRGMSTDEAIERGWLNLREEITGKHSATWLPAITAGLLDADGRLTGREVRLNGRRDTFPHKGFLK